MQCGSFDETDFGSSPGELLQIAAPQNNEDSRKTSRSRRLSVKEIKILRSENSYLFAESFNHSRIKALWKTAFAKVLVHGDPWANFKLLDLPIEFAKRYRYQALKCKWVEDIVRVKLEGVPFNHGAMRECFRAKKLSNFCHTDDWSHALNFVAKRYIDPVDSQVYFDDVRLQMDAKLWGEEFSRQPTVVKKVDIAQMCVIEFINRPGQPLYHLEHFIEGSYRKYNSNSGFVDETARNTPQAFSHFTFERSGHRLIVVDIQGVGDLWTDPQIHTFDGKAYGDGNLGVRGMALFFHTHRCNPLCEALALSPFDLPPDEHPVSISPWDHNLNGSADGNRTISQEKLNFSFGETMANPKARRQGVHICPFISDSYDRAGYGSKNFPESHSLPSSYLPFLPIASTAFVDYNNNFQNRLDNIEQIPSRITVDTDESKLEKLLDEYSYIPSSMNNLSYDSGISFEHSTALSMPTRQISRYTNDSSDGDNSSSRFNEIHSQETELYEFFRAHQAGHRSSSVAGLRGADSVILGLVHHELARLHVSGRLALLSQQRQHPSTINSFNKQSEKSVKSDEYSLALSKNVNVNWQAVLFHEEQSATLNCLDAIQCLAQYYLNIPIDGPLADCPIKPNPSDALPRGLALISTAASAGDRAAMLYLANANYTGIGNTPLSNEEARPDWVAAAHWYEAASKLMNFPDQDNKYESDDDEQVIARKNKVGFDSLVDWPIYRLHGRLAELYAQGGHGLQKDCAKAYQLFESAAEGATEALDGRLAMKYYEQAALLEC